MRSKSSTLFDFVAIGELADTTKQLIALNLHFPVEEGSTSSGLEQVEQIVWQQARDYLGAVREGFVLSIRTADVTSRNELGYLLERVLLDWKQFSEELGLDEEDSDASTPAQEVQHIRNQLLAFGMAAIAIGALPRMPKETITFPHSYSRPPTYADIPVPATPAQMLERIEELEKMIWQMTAYNLPELVQRRYGEVRRTYGFFESSAWLAQKESRRFGVKRQRSSLL